MTYLTPSRDALAKALHDADDTVDMRYCSHVVDCLINAGAVIDATTLADDDAVVEAIAADQREAACSWGDPLPGSERKLRARTALRALAAALTEREATR